MKRILSLILALALMLGVFTLPVNATADTLKDDSAIITLAGAPNDALAPKATYRCKVNYTVQAKISNGNSYVRVKVVNKSNFTISKVKLTCKCYGSNYKGYKGTKTPTWTKTIKSGKTVYTSWYKLPKGTRSFKYSFSVYGARRWWK